MPEKRIRVVRTIFTYSILLIVIAWLILSYVPTSLLSLPQSSPLPITLAPWAGWLSFFGFALFFVLQFWLVRSTVQFFSGGDSSRSERLTEFNLRLSVELFWTLLPILMTVGLAAAGYQFWVRWAVM